MTVMRGYFCHPDVDYFPLTAHPDCFIPLTLQHFAGSFTLLILPACNRLELLDAALEEEESGTLIARKVGEAVQNTLGAVVTAIDIPLGG